MRIEQIHDGKKRFLDLLLIADEQEDMIDKYLDEGELFVLFDPGPVSVGVVTDRGDGSCELKNLATAPECRGRGYGRELIAFLSARYAAGFTSMYVGTGETPSILRFYESCGFRPSHRIEDFFTDHYDHPIIDEGCLLSDMVYLKKELEPDRMDG